MRVLVDEGPSRVHELIALGATFDRDPQGDLELAREGGHSLPRIVHAGGAATGAEIERTLVDAVRAEVSVVLESSFALDLIVEGGRCRGVVAADPRGRRTEVRAANVLVATGGYGQLFAVTTNPEEATGDGVAMAIRAGVAVADIEFEQFHPTALHHPVMPRPLLTEALRGHGALLRDAQGRAVRRRAALARQGEPGHHRSHARAGRRAPLARRHRPRALRRAVPDHRRRAHQGGARPGRRTGCRSRRPRTTAAAGSSPTSTAPRRCPGLWVAGEASCNGVMGANRLASNSLLDGMVFGPRVVEAIDRGVDGPERHRRDARAARRRRDRRPADRGAAGRRERSCPTATTLQRTMTTHAGVLRSAESLGEAADACAGQVAGDDPGAWELRNLATVGRLLCAAALAREESRGAHTRTDFDGTARRPPSPLRRRRLIGSLGRA